jgi:hypothetical protein
MAEYGIFEDGACIADGLYGDTGKTAAQAHVAALIAKNPDMADAYEVTEICPDHPEQPKNRCEDCALDGED